VQVACDIPLERFQQGPKLYFRLHLNQRSHAKLWGSKVAGVPTLGISGLPFGSPETKCHLDVGLVERHKVYYKGEGGGFPPSPGCGESYEFELLVVRLSTKSAPTMH